MNVSEKNELFNSLSYVLSRNSSRWKSLRTFSWSNRKCSSISRFWSFFLSNLNTLTATAFPSNVPGCTTPNVPSPSTFCSLTFTGQYKHNKKKLKRELKRVKLKKNLSTTNLRERAFLKLFLALSKQRVGSRGFPIMFFMGSYANSHMYFSCCIAEK